MRVKVFYSFCLFGALLAISVLALAQEGHPMVGTWYGDWGPSANQRNDITIIMSWDGKAITGIINPGPDSFPIKTATLDSTKWTFHLEADGKDEKGSSVHHVADGKLENIGSYNRTVTGTWTAGTAKGTFKLKRD